MGQYYYPVNLDKRQFIHPHKFGDGLKLLEFGCSGDGTMTGLAILLSDGNNRGGGDLHSDNPIIGSWAGDRIVISGDYSDPGKFISGNDEGDLLQYCRDKQEQRDATNDQKLEWAKANCNLHTLANFCFEDISEKVIEAMKDDPYLKSSFKSKEFTAIRPDMILTPNK